ncbi:Hypothetical protein POVR1_LOCUS253 [uncultured virus]|nr:Hypothetical protein POVR1_LOCUS253 [uncultured virus]
MSRVKFTQIDSFDNYSFYSMSYLALDQVDESNQKSIVKTPEDIPKASEYLATSLSDEGFRNPKNQTEAGLRRLNARSNVQVIRLPTSESDVSSSDSNPTRWKVNRGGVGVRFKR